MAIALPTVNSNYYSFANIEFRFGGFFIVGCKSINYGIKVGSQYVRGTNKMPIGRTQGQVEPHGDVEFYLPQFNALVQQLGPNFSARNVNVTVTYGNPSDNAGLLTITDTLLNCTMIEVDASNSESLDANVRKCTLMPMNILYNGVPFATGLPVIGAIG
jgi:hypothetical protein